MVGVQPGDGKKCLQVSECCQDLERQGLARQRLVVGVHA